MQVTHPNRLSSHPQGLAEQYAGSQTTPKWLSGYEVMRTNGTNYVQVEWFFLVQVTIFCWLNSIQWPRSRRHCSSFSTRAASKHRPNRRPPPPAVGGAPMIVVPSPRPSHIVVLVAAPWNLYKCPSRRQWTTPVTSRTPDLHPSNFGLAPTGFRSSTARPRLGQHSSCRPRLWHRASQNGLISKKSVDLHIARARTNRVIAVKNNIRDTCAQLAHMEGDVTNMRKCINYTIENSIVFFLSWFLQRQMTTPAVNNGCLHWRALHPIDIFGSRTFKLIGLWWFRCRWLVLK